MNKYPVWWDQTITIYNRYEDPLTQIVTWYKHTLEKCFWKYNRDSLQIGDTSVETTYIICRIPKNPLFKEKFEWINLPNDEMGNYFTLGPGDIIIKGSIGDVINEYQKGSRSSDVIAKYKDLQGCMQIEEVTNNTGLGRCNEHYLVRGN